MTCSPAPTAPTTPSAALRTRPTSRTPCAKRSPPHWRSCREHRHLPILRRHRHLVPRRRHRHAHAPRRPARARARRAPRRLQPRDQPLPRPQARRPQRRPPVDGPWRRDPSLALRDVHARRLLAKAGAAMNPALPADALPFAPFQDWVRSQVAIHGAEELARRAGVDESLIRRWLAGRYRHRGHEQVIHRIPIDTADQILTRVDDGETLSTLYPDAEPPRRGKGGGKPVGKYRLLTDDQVRAIHRIHIEAGVSIRELARQLHAQFGYSGPKSMANCLSAAFDSLGLDARDRVDAVRLTCTVHGRATREHRDPAWTRAGRVR